MKIRSISTLPKAHAIGTIRLGNRTWYPSQPVHHIPSRYIPYPNRVARKGEVLYIPLWEVEGSIARECAQLILDLLPHRHYRWRITGAQIASIVEEIGERLALMTLREAGFQPSSDDSDNWYIVEHRVARVRTVPIQHFEDFRIHFDKLDVGGRLKTALGLDR